MTDTSNTGGTVSSGVFWTTLVGATLIGLAGIVVVYLSGKAQSSKICLVYVCPTESVAASWDVKKQACACEFRPVWPKRPLKTSKEAK